MTESNRRTKWVLVVGLVAIAVWAIVPPSERLKGGIDLVGGTSLLFEIDTTGLDVDQKRDLSTRVMVILKERVDPSGLMNIEWRPIGHSRLEIRMPRPPAKAGRRRDAYNATVDAIEAMNLSRRELESALNAADADRVLALAALVRDVPERTQLLEALDVASQAYHAVDADADPTAADAARQSYEEALSAVLATSLPMTRLKDMLSAKEDTRDAELQKLRDAHTAFAAQIDACAAAYEKWAPFKSDLEDPADLKRRLKGAGVLEFRILAERDPNTPGNTFCNDPTLKQPIAKWVDQLAARGPRPKPGDAYRWFPVQDVMDFMRLTKIEEFETKKDQPEWPIVETYLGDYYVLTHNDSRYGLLAQRGQQRKPWKLQSASWYRDPLTSQNQVSFTLDARGGILFGDLTGANVNRQLCVFLDGKAMSNANINERIGRRCQISGEFTVERVQDLVRTLEAGALPARLKENPIRENTIGPSLGKTNRDKGFNAAVYGLIAVAIFILLYYGLAAGGMANVALAMNLLFVLAAMAITQSTFTLPGIAGLILTVGMAIDANVLIFERIREERDRGVQFRKALNAGYDKAFSTILDANLTTLITCVILGFLGSEEIKGFATTLGIGITSSMFTSLVVTRMVFNALIRKGWLDDFSMRRIIGVPQVDWLALRSKFWPISLVVSIGGIAAFVTVAATDREAIFDIEFLGGTSVQIDLREGVDLLDEEVRDLITSGEPGSATAWLERAAQSVEDAEVGAAGARAFTMTSDKLTGRELGMVMRGTLDRNNRLESGGVEAEGNTVTFYTVEGVTPEIFQEEIAEAVNATRTAATRLRGARVQSVKDVSVEGVGLSYEISTVETNRPLVQGAIVAAMGNRLVVQRALSYTVNDNEESGEPFFVVEQTDQYLADVIDASARYDIGSFKGGVVIDVTIEEQDPITVEEVTRRLKELRLQHEFEDYQQRKTAVFGLGASETNALGERAFKRFAVVVVDDALLYDDDAVRWTEEVAQVELAQVRGALGSEKSLSKVLQFDAQIAGQAQQEAMFAVGVALLAIVIYVWLRFGTALFGLAAIVALVHDVCITLGLVTLSHFVFDNALGRAIGLTDFKIDLAMIAALLTVIGYSLNDTIVVFDRIRENRGRLGSLSPAIINTSINQTLARTILTSFTTFVVVFLLYVFGGAGVHGFAFALLIGVVVGSYSSIAIAAPLLYRPKLLVRVVLVIALLGVFGAIFVMASGTTWRLAFGGVAVAIFAWAMVKSEAAVAGQPGAAAPA